jgi:ABC-type polysaccharide/polyol phosphate transport system ATPase subunit
MSIIEVGHLSKEYRLGAMQGLKQTLLNSVAKLVGNKLKEPPPFKALNDISFSIEQGEVVGIIGHNGAGKSTLLKMLAGISTPTRGNITVQGRIAPLIEVGAGFVPDFTGRENVYLNGAIMGLSRKEIDQKFDEIVDFAEIEEFIDTPVKRYSSGMQVKLAFAVASSVEAEILIVDEVLAVGDLAFQRKCFDRMEDMIKRQARTVLLVSHNIRQVERLCSRALLLDHGRIIMDARAQETCNAYYEQNDLKIKHQAMMRHSNVSTTGEVELLDLFLTDFVGNKLNAIQYCADFTVVIRVRVNKPLVKPIIVFGVHTTDFVYITTAASPHEVRLLEFPCGVVEVKFVVERCPLLPGAYSVRLSLDVEDPIKNIFYGDNLINFTVVSSELQRTSSQCEGFFLLETKWNTPQYILD